MTTERAQPHADSRCAGTRRRLSDTLATLFFWPAFVSTLVAFEILQRIALAAGRRAHEMTVVWLNRSLVLVLSGIGTKVRIEGVEPAPGAPLVVLSNHQSLFDIPLLHCAFARHFPRYVAKTELGRWIPSISLNLRRGGNALIDRAKPAEAASVLRELGRRMAELSFATVVFPEGTRSRDGALGRFRALGVAALLQGCPGARVVPVAIDGSWEIARWKLFPVAAGRRVRVLIGPELAAGGPKELVSAAERWIASALDEAAPVSRFARSQT